MQQAVHKKALGAVKWSGLIELVSRTASPLIMVVLARLLTPADFGTVSTAMIAVTLVNPLWEGGLGRALIQSNEPPEETANEAFWMNCCLGVLVYGLLFLAAPAIGDFFRSPGSGAVLRVLGLQVMLGALMSVQQTLLIRELQFRRLFWIRFLTALIPGCFSVPMALLGLGVWALVAGTLAGSAASVVLLWAQSDWRPRREFDWARARRLLGFGFWAMGESLLLWLFLWGDNLLVGRYLGLHELGLYRTGSLIAMVIFSSFLNPFLPVLYPTFSRLQDEPLGLWSTFDRANRVVITVALPLGAGLLLTGPLGVEVLFGPKWSGMGIVLSLMGCRYGLAWLVGINNEVYRAKGRPDVAVKVMVATLLVYLPAWYASVQFGMRTFLFTYVGLTVIGILPHAYAMARLFGTSALYLLKQSRSSGVAVGVMCSVLVGVEELLPTDFGWKCGWLGLASQTTLGAAVYVGSICALDRRFVESLVGMIRRAV